MKKNSTAAKSSLQTTATKKTALTADQEMSLVIAAKKGDLVSRDRLYLANIDEIEKAHIHSAVGTNPSRFGKGRNRNGLTYREDSGRLFEVFVSALEKFDVNMVNLDSFQNTTPFLSFLKYEISHRALDKARSEQTYRERYVSMAEVTKNAGKGKEKANDDYRSDEELLAIAQEKALEHATDRSAVYDSDADDARNRQLSEMVDKMISLFPEHSKEHETLTNFLVALGYAKNVIPEVAARMKITKPTVYKYMDLVLQKVPAKMAKEFREALAA